MRVQIITIVLTQMKISFDKQNFKKRISDIKPQYMKNYSRQLKKELSIIFFRISQL